LSGEGLVAGQRQGNDADDWVRRIGIRDHRSGMTLVHADGHAGTEQLGPGVDFQQYIDVPSRLQPRTREQFDELERWMTSAHHAAVSGGGFGTLAYADGTTPVVHAMEALPPRLLWQKNVMQALRGPALTTRAGHQIDTGLQTGRLLARAGFRRNAVEAGMVMGYVHDTGQHAFPHQSESAIERFRQETQPHYVPHSRDHATASGLYVASLPWPGVDPALRGAMVYGVSHHSWQHPYGRLSPLAGVFADLAGAADRLTYVASDYCDAIAAGRAEWTAAGISADIPQVLALGKVSKRELEDTVALGFNVGRYVLQDRLSLLMLWKTQLSNHYAAVIGRRRFGSARR
jgi:hypothetical protein